LGLLWALAQGLVAIMLYLSTWLFE